MKQVKWMFLLSLLLLCFETLAVTATTWLQKHIIDDVFLQGHYEKLGGILLLFAVSFIAYAVLFTIAPHTFHRIQAKIRSLLTHEFMGYMQKIPVQTYHNNRVTKYVHFLSYDVEQIAGTIGGFLPRFFQTVVTIVLLSIIILLSSPLLLLSIFLFGILYVLTGKYFVSRIRQATKDVQNKKTDLLIHMEEGIASTREVMAFNRLNWETKMYNKYFRKYFDAVMTEAKITNRQLLASEPIKWGANIIVLGYGGYGVIQGTISIGLFLVVYQFTSQLMDALQRLFEYSMNLSSKYALIDRIRSVMDGPIEKQGSIPLKENVKEIRFEKVSFSYQHDEEKQVLNDLTLTIPTGKKVAFVGTSGGGKSTIAQLLIRFYHQTEGEMYVNGIPFHQVKYSDWMKKVGIVSQEPYLFPDTIRNNITMGRKNISDEQIDLAITLTEMNDYIKLLPHGLETKIGERGITLSGGQRQRLALARVIVNNPEVLILDEATSALDLETERKVQGHFDHIRRGKTTIVIAHRLSTVRNADVIFVMDKGQITAKGTHDELLESSMMYKQLVYADQTYASGA